MQPMLVAAAVIRRNHKMLISQRMQGSFEAGKWEFPGGKIEFLEHPEDALIREVKEELNIDIRVDKLFTISSHIYERDSQKKHVILLVFLAHYLSGDVTHLEVADAQWVSLNELQKFDFTAADLPVIQQLQSL